MSTKSLFSSYSMEYIGFGSGPVATVDDTGLGFECCLYCQDGGGLLRVSGLGLIY